MSISLGDFLKELPADHRQEIEAGTRELIAEEYNLRDLRAARARSQQQIAERLGVNQAAVSKLERRADMYVSSLREYIEANGGNLEIVARFPDRPPIRITQFAKI
jgi:DNA-binding XRE family transcriptional regulator